MDKEKTWAEKAEVKLNPRFDRGDDEIGKITKEEEDLPLGTIHLDLENRIWVEIRMIR